MNRRTRIAIAKRMWAWADTNPPHNTFAVANKLSRYFREWQQ